MKQKIPVLPSMLARQFSIFDRQTRYSSASYSYQRFEVSSADRQIVSTTIPRITLPYSFLKNVKRFLENSQRTYCIALNMPAAQQKCWNCAKDLQTIPTSGLFCDGCGSLRNTTDAMVFLNLFQHIKNDIKVSASFLLGLFRNYGITENVYAGHAHANEPFSSVTSVRPSRQVQFEVSVYILIVYSSSIIYCISIYQIFKGARNIGGLEFSN